MAQVKKDYLGAGVIGIIAAVLSKVMITNLEIQISYPIFAVFIFFICIAGMFVARVFLKKKILSLYQFVKFGETGGLNTFIDLGILNLLILLSGISGGAYYSVFKGTSFLVAVTNSYFWNRFWVFESKEKKKTADEAMRFYIISFIGFIINVLVATVIVNFGANLINVGGNLLANIGAVAAFVITMMFNFFGYKFFVFIKTKESKQETHLDK